jgi:TfoX/Sxy family transcriptional regulator of competence genes
MASTQDFVEYIVDQAGITSLTFKKMFGEYALYVDGKVVAFVCDNTLFVKPLPENEALCAPLEKGPAYPGSKNYHIVDEDHLEKREWLRGVLQHTADVQPMPKPKIKKKPNQ